MCAKVRYIFQNKFFSYVTNWVYFLPFYFYHSAEILVTRASTHSKSCCFPRNSLINILHGSVLEAIKLPGSTKEKNAGTEGQLAR